MHLKLQEEINEVTTSRCHADFPRNQRKSHENHQNHMKITEITEITHKSQKSNENHRRLTRKPLQDVM